MLKATIPALMCEADAVLPDRLAGIPGLGERPVRAVDGTYQEESVHYQRRTPSEGGKDNPKGHALLSFFNLRLGLADDVHVDTRSCAETKLLRDYDQGEQALTREKNGLWLVDRAFIDAGFWDAKKRRLRVTMITRMKSNLRADSTEGLPVDDDPVNEGVERDLRVTLSSSPEPWRIVTFRTRRGWTIEFLAIITGILVVLMRHRTLGADCASGEKALRKQDKRQCATVDDGDGTDRPDWAAPIYRYTSKVSRQVLRFFKLCWLMRPSV